MASRQAIFTMVKTGATISAPGLGQTISICAEILACVQAFEGIELERFEGKSVAQYIASETRLRSAGSGASGSFDLVLDGGACGLLIEAC